LRYREVREWPQILLGIALAEIGNYAHDFSPGRGWIRECHVIPDGVCAWKKLLHKGFIDDCYQTAFLTVGIPESTPGTHGDFQR
jgi:hypothetical protein